MNEFDNPIVTRIADLIELIEFNNYLGKDDRSEFLIDEVEYLKNKLK